ncbi:MAG: right-handed parallel beta-helix repeat-containing protein, partial [Methanomicrobiales archaeon]
MKKCFQPAYALAILSVIICISVIPLNAQADVITVCPAGCNFTKIQDAINYAADGDSIQVMSGSYNEVIEINKSVNLSGIASSGEYPHIGRYTMPVAVTVSAPGVTFEGFDIHGEGEHAIELKASHVTVRNVTVGIHRPGYEGDAVIEGIGISDITIADCMMQSTGGYGIYFQDCLDLVVERNEIIVNNQTTEVSQRAIASIYSPLDADYSGVRIEHNAVTGGTIESSVIWQEEADFTPSIHDILIRNNSVTNSNGPAITVNAPPDYSGTGVIMYHLSDIAVLDNNVFDSEKGTGIGVWGAMDSLISGNEVKNLKDYSSGIDLSDSTRINVSHNTISDCTGEDATGLSLYDVTASTVSGNQLDRNTYNFLFESAENFTPMMDIDSTNLADGRPIRYYEGMDNFSVDG